MAVLDLLQLCISGTIQIKSYEDGKLHVTKDKIKMEKKKSEYNLKRLNMSGF